MNTTKKLLFPGVIALATFASVSGASILSSMSASAATTSSTTNPAAATQAATSTSTQPDPSQGGHVGANGTKEVLLTGDTATKATAAAEAAVPGATVLRVENDAEGATYEAHMKKTDGSQVTVKMDANFKVTGTEAGPNGPAGDISPSTTTNN
jgi:uncharacterized membrane protein YkoI